MTASYQEDMAGNFLPTLSATGGSIDDMLQAQVQYQFFDFM